MKQKLQYFGHLLGRADSLEKTLIQGKIECRSRRGQQRWRWLDDITDSMDICLSKLQDEGQERMAWYSPWGCKELGTLYNWTTVINETMESEMQLQRGLLATLSWVLWASLANFGTWRWNHGNSWFVAKLDRSMGLPGTPYLWLASEVMAVVWDWDLKPVKSNTNFR